MGTWSHTAGRRPNRVTVFERKPGGNIYVRVWKGEESRAIVRSLKHRDKERAKVYAAEQHAKLVKGEDDRARGVVRLHRLFALYREARTPTKSKTERKADARRIELWLRILGPDTDAHSITSRAWDGFIRDRRCGAIDARGRRVLESKACPECHGAAEDCKHCDGTGRVHPRRPVGDRTVESDCLWLRWVLNWGVNERTGPGSYLLRENAVRGFDVPRERNPARPVASRDRFEAIRAVTDQVRMEIRWGEGRAIKRSWLSELFDLAMATGRRLSPICALRSDDLDLGRGPFGYVRWRADMDKSERETLVPIDAEARAAIDRQIARRAAVGRTYLFPSPTSDAEPMSRHLADKWLRKAEELAGVEPHEGSLWHAYRRGWATARKQLPSADVARLGGWSGTETLERVYQQADEGTMLEIVQARHELREARQ